MSRGGACHKIIRKATSISAPSPVSRSFLPSSRERQAATVFCGRTSALAMDSHNRSSGGASNSDNQAGNTQAQDDMAASSRVSWRPYRGRWNSKGASLQNPSRVATKPRENTSMPKGRGGKTQNKPRNPDRQLKNGLAHTNRQSERPFSPHKAPFADSNQPLNGPTSLRTPTGFPMLNPFNVINSFPGNIDTPAQPEFSTPFPGGNTPDQQQWQFPMPFNQSTLNPFGFPLLNGMNPIASLPSLLPAAPFMDFSMLNSAGAAPMLDAFNRMAAGMANPPGVAPFTGQQQWPEPIQGRTLKLPERPAATKRYLDQSSLSPKLSASPQPLLIILDLNGTLIFRKSRRLPPNFVRRAGLDHFLDTLIDKYNVMIWSSSQPPTVDAVCQKLFPEHKRKKLVAEWGRDKFGLTDSQYKSKIQVYKTLEAIWSNKKIQASYPKNFGSGGSRKSRKRGPAPPKTRWDQTNTILIDDSKLKALSEPYNLIEIPEFTNAPNVDESLIFPKVLQLLEVLAQSDDVSKLLKLWNSQLSSSSATTSILDLDVKASTPGFKEAHDQHQPSKRAATTAASHTQESSSTTSIPLDPAQARKERRRARKQEKKAARRAAAATIPISSVPKISPTSPLPDPPSSTTSHLSPEEQNGQSASPSSREQERSPSPVSSVQSENFLLDRLEESLNS